MKSDKTRWSDEDVDELLTTFFRSEVPARLREPLHTPVRRRATTKGFTPTTAGSRSKSARRSMLWAGCTAVALLAIAVAFQFGGGDAPSTGGEIAMPATDEPDEPINVKGTDPDAGDIAVPEQDIEIIDD